jgi:hypothetical protein
MKKRKTRNSKKTDAAKPSSEADISASNSSDATVEFGSNTADVEKELIVVKELVKEVKNEQKEKSKNSEKTDMGKLSSEADVSASNSSDATVEVGGNTADVEKDSSICKSLVIEKI